jgi:hypothetical protein
MNQSLTHGERASQRYLKNKVTGHSNEKIISGVIYLSRG